MRIAYAVAPMDRQSTFLLALGLLIVAAAVVSAGGWVLFVRDRRAGRGEDRDEDVRASMDR